MLEKEEKQLTRDCLAMALEAGAEKARASLSKNTMNIVATLDGEVDKVTSCLDRSISLNLYVDGRYGTFSTNKLDRESLRAFICKAVSTTRMLAADACRDLPDSARTAKDASKGNELGICDPAWRGVTPDQRIAFALENCVQARMPGRSCSSVSLPPHTRPAQKTSPEEHVLPVAAKGWKLISEDVHLSKLFLQVGHTVAVFVAEVFLHIQRLALLHVLPQGLMSHEHRVEHGILIVFEVVLVEH